MEGAVAEVGRRQRVAALFRETGAAHHRAFAARNGEDPDWPRWYAEHLSQPLGQLFERTFDPESLGADLAAADAEHRARAPQSDWQLFYADWLLTRYGRG